MKLRVIESDFSSQGARCAGRLYLPEVQTKPPVVVLGHGLGALKEFRMTAFAERFAQSGLAAFVFDYRHWGESEGEPRQVLIPARQLHDWQAAIAHVRGLSEVDGERLGIWGSSFGGAHVIHVAAADHAVRAVVAQVPAADTLHAVGAWRPATALRSLAYAATDALRAQLGLRPLYLPIVSRAGDLGVLNTEECWDGYLGLVPNGSRWRNEIAARSLLFAPLYRAVKVAQEVAAPALIMAGSRDSLISIEDVRILAAKLRDCELQEIDCNHFQPYYPPFFERFVTEQARFLRAKLTS